MKNLLDYSVQELNAKEVVSIDGGWTRVWYKNNHNGTWTRYEEIWHRNKLYNTSHVITDSVPSWVTDAIS